jgi:hypothetical protein
LRAFSAGPEASPEQQARRRQPLPFISNNIFDFKQIQNCNFAYGVDEGKYEQEHSMSCVPSELAELASVNLHFAQAEVAMGGDRESIARALDHIRQAKACLKIMAAELNVPSDEEMEAA